MRGLVVCALVIMAVMTCSMTPAETITSFKIITDKQIGQGRRVEVQIKRRISNSELEIVSNAIKNMSKKHFSKTLIFYYLPFQSVGGNPGAWATAFFEPTLKAEIRLASIEQVHQLNNFSIKSGWRVPSSKAANPKDLSFAALLDEGPNTLNYGGKIIGEYIYDLPGGSTDNLSNKITIFQKGGRYMMNQYFLDGTQKTKVMKVSSTSRGTKLETSGYGLGDYFVLNKKRELELWDKDGLIEKLYPQGH